jgi:hypothetical protein
MERPVKDGSLLGGWVEEAQTVSGWEVGMRRLITLIFVDRDKPAIMVVIRRELPRTTCAGSGWTARIDSGEDSPMPWTGPAADSLRFMVSALASGGLCGKGEPFSALLGLYPNGPDKAQQLARHRSHGQLRTFASRTEFAVPIMQALLSSPGNLPDLRALSALSCCQSFADGRTMPISPGCFHHDPAHMRIPGFADRAATDALTAGVLARDHAGVTHQLTRMRKAAELSQLGYQGDRRDFGHSA